MRKKLYEKSMILEGAYAVAKEEGFDELTARRIARRLNMSTQPIYLAFENMDVLRQALINNIFEDLEMNYFSKKQTIVEFTLNYYQFAVDYPELYQSLLTNSLTIGPFQKAIFKLFSEIAEVESSFSELETQIVFARIAGTVASLCCLTGQGDNQPMIKKLLGQSIQIDTELIVEQQWTETMKIN
jgi:AcrR family transcriptional regulator